MALMLGAWTVGLILSLLALGVFISFRVFKFPDITTEGSITLGAAILAGVAAARAFARGGRRRRHFSPARAPGPRRACCIRGFGINGSVVRDHRDDGVVLGEPAGDGFTATFRSSLRKHWPAIEATVLHLAGGAETLTCLRPGDPNAAMWPCWQAVCWWSWGRPACCTSSFRRIWARPCGPPGTTPR